MSRDFVGALLQLNAEKQISREQLIGAVEDGIQSAYRRVAGDEDIHVRIDAETGKIRVFRARRVVGEIEDEFTEMTIEQAHAHPADADVGDLVETEQLDGDVFGRIGAQTAKQIVLQRHPRGRARPGLRPVREPRGRAHDRHRQPGRAAGDHPRRRQERRGDPGHDRAVGARALPDRPERQGLRARGPSLDQGSADLRQPDAQGLPQAPVRARGPRDPRRHRRDQGHRPRGRQPLEGRRRVAPGRARPGRRHRRPARRPRPGRRRRAVRREDRRHPVERRRQRLRRQRAQPGAGHLRRHRRGAPHRERDRSRADAVAGDRPRGPERPAGRAADRLADRHPERRVGRRGPCCRGCRDHRGTGRDVAADADGTPTPASPRRRSRPSASPRRPRPGPRRRGGGADDARPPRQPISARPTVSTRRRRRRPRRRRPRRRPRPPPRPPRRQPPRWRRSRPSAGDAPAAKPKRTRKAAAAVPSEEVAS